MGSGSRMYRMALGTQMASLESEIAFARAEIEKVKEEEEEDVSDIFALQQKALQGITEFLQQPKETEKEETKPIYADLLDMVPEGGFDYKIIVLIGIVILWLNR